MEEYEDEKITGFWFWVSYLFNIIEAIICLFLTLTTRNLEYTCHFELVTPFICFRCLCVYLICDDRPHSYFLSCELILCLWQTSVCLVIRLYQNCGSCAYRMREKEKGVCAVQVSHLTDNKGTRAVWFKRIAKRTVQIRSDGTGVQIIPSHPKLLVFSVYEKGKILYPYFTSSCLSNPSMW